MVVPTDFETLEQKIDILHEKQDIMHELLQTLASLQQSTGHTILKLSDQQADVGESNRAIRLDILRVMYAQVGYTAHTMDVILQLSSAVAGSLPEPELGRVFLEKIDRSIEMKEQLEKQAEIFRLRINEIQSQIQ